MSSVYIDKYHEQLEQDFKEYERLIWELCGGNYELLKQGESRNEIK